MHDRDFITTNTLLLTNVWIIFTKVSRKEEVEYLTASGSNIRKPINQINSFHCLCHIAYISIKTSSPVVNNISIALRIFLMKNNQQIAADVFKLLLKLPELKALIKTTFVSKPELHERLWHFRQLRQQPSVQHHVLKNYFCSFSVENMQ